MGIAYFSGEGKVPRGPGAEPPKSPGAQGWKLSNEDESVDLSVDYDFEPEDVKEGVYQITFSTTGREFKIHTTDYTEEGQEVGLTFFPEDIHVMSKEVF